MSKAYLILPMILILLCMGFISGAEENSLGVVKLGDCVTIRQTCSSCSYVNLSVAYPNSTIVVNNQVMADQGAGLWIFDFCNTSDLNGRYDVTGEGDISGTATSFGALWFMVTPNGEDPSTSKGAIQISLLGFLILFFFIALIGIFKFDHYIAKFTLYWVCHVLLISITFISWQMSNDFLTGTPMIAGMFKIAFYFFAISVIPMVLLSMTWIFYIHLMNDDIQKMMDRGMDQDDAYDRARSKKRW